MLASITPLGERGHHRRWRTTVSFYLVGSTTAAAAVGWSLGRLGELTAGWLRPSPLPAVEVALLCGLAALTDAGVFGARLPSVRRQVNEDWLDRYRTWVIGLGYGAQLGSGVLTIVTTSTVYLAWLLALGSGSATGGLAVGVTFGLVRALPILAVRSVSTPADLVRTHRRLESWAGPARIGTVLSVLVVGAFALVLGTTG